LWDNNFLANRFWPDIVKELEELQLEVDFNQGLDAAFITKTVAKQLSKLKLPIIRLSFDLPSREEETKKAIENLKEAGFNGRRILVYTLYNFIDTPGEFFERVRKLLEWGVVCYPMRFEPLDALEKNQHIAPKWSREQLEMVQKARRVIGYGGAFPPYEGLVFKFKKARNFHEAFSLRK